MKLSIVTINLNNVAGLHETIISVLNQSSADLEYIIIDGGSTDGSAELIKEYSDRIYYWVSEPDSGIYNAMNKGIRKASGEYLLFLNSGDALASDNIVEEVFRADHNEEILYGDITYFSQKEKKVIRTFLQDDLDLYFFYKQSLWHQAAFIKKTLFERIGLYNENNRYVSDWQFFFEAVLFRGATYKNLTKVITRYDMANGISVLNAEDSENEKKELLFRKLGMPVMDLLEKYGELARNIDQIQRSDKFILFRAIEKHKFLFVLNLFFLKAMKKIFKMIG